MRLLRQAMAVVGTVTMIAVLVAVLAPQRAHALVAALVQVVPGTTTHVGQNESRLVSLKCFDNTSYCSLIDPVGDVSNTPYVVPSGYTLIVTDFESVGSSTCGLPGRLWPDNLYNTNNGQNISPTTWGLGDNIGTSHAHEHYSTGIRVGSGATLADFGASGNCGEGSVQGYLVPSD